MGLKISEVWHTECPVPSATNIAVDQGWLQSEFEIEGIKVSHISYLPFEDRLCHFSHRQTRLFRDGGCIPAIWAKSDGVETKVIGMVFSEARQAILVRKDSTIESVEELKGKRVALPRDVCSLIDFRRATTKRGIIMALKAHGLNQDDVQFVDLPLNLANVNRPGGVNFTKTTEPESPPAAGKKPAQQVELEALQCGKVDAIFSYLGREFILEQTGVARVIYNLNKQ